MDVDGSLDGNKTNGCFILDFYYTAQFLSLTVDLRCCLLFEMGFIQPHAFAVLFVYKGGGMSGMRIR
jgi:hypothetical protein